MNLDNLKKRFKSICNALSKLDDALTDMQLEFASERSETGIQIYRLLEGIEFILSGLDKMLLQIAEKIELLKSFKGS